MSRYDEPPEHLTWYHLPWLLQAEAAGIRYDFERYRNHGISNNALALCWAGLLADGDSEMVLTDLGRTMLTDWKASPEGQAWLASEAELYEGTDEPLPHALPEPEAWEHGLLFDLEAS